MSINIDDKYAALKIDQKSKQEFIKRKIQKNEICMLDLKLS